MVRPSRRQQEKSEHTRRELLAAGVRVFARHGYAGATVAAIAAEAGYAKGSFYRHWASKEDAFFALIDEGMAEQHRRIRAAWEAAGTVPELVAAGFRTMAEATADPQWNALFAELWAHAARNEAIRRRMAAVYGRWFHLLVTGLRELQATGSLPPALDADKLAATAVALFDGFNVQRALRLNALGSDDLAAVLYEVLHLAPPPRPEPPEPE